MVTANIAYENLLDNGGIDWFDSNRHRCIINGKLMVVTFPILQNENFEIDVLLNNDFRSASVESYDLRYLCQRLWRCAELAS